MLDPRIYRTGLVAVALAVIVARVLAAGPAGAAGHDAGARRVQRARTRTPTMTAWQQGYPDRRPGSVGDDALATSRRQTLPELRLGRLQHRVHRPHGRRHPDARDGDRRRGPACRSGSIVIVAHRDSLRLAGDRPTSRERRCCSSWHASSRARRCITRSCSPRPAARPARPARPSWRAASGTGRRGDRARRSRRARESAAGRRPVVRRLAGSSADAAQHDRRGARRAGGLAARRDQPGGAVRASGVAADDRPSRGRSGARGSRRAALDCRRARSGGRRAGRAPTAHRRRPRGASAINALDSAAPSRLRRPTCSSTAR